MTRRLSSIRMGLLLLVLLAIIPAIGLTIYSATERRQQDATNAQREALTLIRLISAEQEQLIEETHHFLGFLARQPELPIDNPVACSRYFADLLDQYPRYGNLGVIDLDGNLSCSAVPLSEPLNLATMPYFQRALQSRDLAIGQYHIQVTTGRPILPLGYPVFDQDGNVRGVAVAGLDLNWLNEFVTNTELPSGSTLTVADKNGVVMARFPDPQDWVGQSISEQSLFQQMAAAGSEGVGESHGLDGVPKLYAFTKLGEPDQSGEIYISIGIPKSVAYGPADQALQRHLLGLGIALALTVGIAWFGTDLFMLRRVRALIAATHKLAAGDFKSRSGLKGGGGEFGLLGEAFDRMAQELEEHEEERAARIREQAQRAEAEAARERITSILESINDAFFAVDRDWRFTYLNSNASQVMQQLTGKTVDELIGQDMWGELSQFLGSRFYEEYHRAIAQQVSVRFEEFCPQLKVWLEVHAHPSADGLSIFFQDITDRKRAEEALLEADRRKDEFLAMLSHELRNPLAPIANAVELLRRCQGNASIQQVALSALDNQVSTLTRLVDDLLDVSRVTTGRIQLQRTDVDLNALVRNVAESFRPQLSERRHEFSVCLSGISLWAHADSTRLEQVLVNLLSNAAKYTPEGGQIWLTVVDNGSEALIRVKDSGMGIDARLLPDIFELFSQGTRTLDRAQGGLGVGLPLVKSLVEMHSGTVTATSEGPGQGSEFVVRLPTVPDPTMQPVPTPETPARLPARSLRVLLVDDIADTREIFGRLLEVLGYQVRTAHDGPAAIEAALEFQPDVVLLDVGLPEMDGYQVAKRLRQEVALRNVVLVAVTGYGQQSDRQRSQEAGFDHHLVKPPDIDALQKVLAAIGGTGT